MPNYIRSIYQQAMVVLDSSHSVSGLPTAGYPLIPVQSNTTELGSTPQTESRIRTAMSSVPVVRGAQLQEEYWELAEALSEMTQLEQAEEWKIEAAVYNAACYVAAGLMANSFPVPRVFNHGSQSVVFNWSDGSDNLYLTVSADRMSAMISSPERIKQRVDLSLVDPSRALSFVRAAYYKKPVKQLIAGTVTPPEAVGF